MPAGIAIAMSILLKPEDLQPGNAPMLALVSALAVVRAIEEQTGLRAARGSYETEDFKDISHYALIRLAKFYGVTADYLLGLI